ncbi:twin-arginine translocation pathway signal protein [Ramlibacter sp. WS9]|uniref:Acg family FMN-binding oxidoreductase n=1 Tax=Ramlibacter sp. WS9 TaxID=1882741 RepID=UPI0011411973|nr:twin-arginine translocation pathway signal protein [Ramlibacter sp. WS9]ROZ62012.1 twin-arginine translocation pathway signal protein [Ramlibacter sp. WS9]
MDRRQFIRVAGGGVIASAVLPLAGCALSGDYPAEAVQAWKGPGEEADVRRWVLGYAILAPHSHNLQSWLVDLGRPDEITLYCDLTRLLPETDPLSRQIMMSHGTFVELLDLAARQKGLRADVELFPQGEFGPAQLDKRPVARIRLVPDARVNPDPLFGQILLRHTNREAYEPREPVPAALQAITDSVASHRIRVGFAGSAQPEQLQKHRAIASEAWRIELVTPRTIMESYKVLRVGPAEIARYRDGLSINTPMVRALTTLGLFDRSKAPGPHDAATTGQIKDFNAKITTTPAFFWLVTEGNDRKTQVNAGRAYARAQLAATAQGLAMQPLSQALQEYPEQAKLYAGIHALVEAPQPRFTVQMWTRLGYAPPVQPAPRRGVDAHIVTA